MQDEHISLDHGSGGRLSHELVTEQLLPLFDNPILSRMDDGAALVIDGVHLAFSTDTFVVDPLFFPGGSIGELAVNGTVNDLAMCGAVPLYLGMGLIIEEGFSQGTLMEVLTAMRRAAQRAGVQVVTGDTKVVPRGAVDKLFINTSGIGRIPKGRHLSSDAAKPGDAVLLSGTMADHGMTILNAREKLAFSGEMASDTAALHDLVAAIFSVTADVHVLRDPTRGGVGTALGEIAARSRVGIDIREANLPVNGPVAGMCDLLGIDPLYVANEGKLLAFVAPEVAGDVLAAMRSHPLGRGAVVLGQVVAEHPGKVYMNTRIGGRRIVPMLTGEQLPRIC